MRFCRPLAAKRFVAAQDQKSIIQDEKTKSEPMAITDDAIESISVLNEIIATSPTSAITDMPEDNPKAITKTDNTAPTSKDNPWQSGLLQKLWTWFTDLFAFKN